MESGNILNHVGNRVSQNTLPGKSLGKLFLFDCDAFSGSLIVIIEGR